ncbi:MAG TPA: 50S ribosomal protein L23 [Acidobacteriota bacterium]|jgi:large subunit ribosomal protein L23|nr:50S ribosomal protein L23 [Acidobacteriota bacterium]NLI46393.1 50S ribosomal protein L23 [Acidobacteriota bacterium]HNR38353.1 50S ribosomal protein L23 [Acidobacteriota bacterium]HNU00791.1 50S ribosomal protein L23 [Acidobacteriota bacterium]HOB51536.1 50S ribosomal protein L23 [Acidobacteriota bacterium]
MKDIYQILRKPHLTEKSVTLKNDAGFVAFRVHPDANKPEIAAAIERLFNVKVESIRILNMPQKKRRMGRYEGHKPAYKKALVKLKPGEKMIEYFDNI